MRKFGKKLRDRSIKAAGGQPLRFEIDLIPITCGILTHLASST